jgi:hypothetical protein
MGKNVNFIPYTPYPISYFLFPISHKKWQILP